MVSNQQYSEMHNQMAMMHGDVREGHDLHLMQPHHHSEHQMEEQEESDGEEGHHSMTPGMEGTSGGDPRASAMLPEQDRLLPIANVTRLMRTQIPEAGKMAKEARELVQDCASEFISFITSHANERCLQERRKVVTSDDLLDALRDLGFDEYIEPMAMFLNRYRRELGKEGLARPPIVHPPPGYQHDDGQTHQKPILLPQTANNESINHAPTSLQPANIQILVDPETGQHYMTQPGEDDELALIPIEMTEFVDGSHKSPDGQEAHVGMVVAHEAPSIHHTPAVPQHQIVIEQHPMQTMAPSQAPKKTTGRTPPKKAPPPQTPVRETRGMKRQRLE
ncbi:unnamed protein product, partial [Mesorhabditis spiculigera]